MRSGPRHGSREGPVLRAAEDEATFIPSSVSAPQDASEVQGDLRHVASYFGSLRLLGQLASSYLVCEGAGGTLVVIDQHAAHERVLFERLRRAQAERAIASQRLLIPVVVELGVAESEALEEHAGRLRALGFELEPFGGQSWSVGAVPAPLAARDPRPVLVDLAGQLAQLGVTDAAEDATNDVLATVACHAAVRAHDSLAPEELRALLGALDSIDFKARCPHGRRVATEIPLVEIERRVDRR
jgi:DNA mismatch repair protein MutL